MLARGNGGDDVIENVLPLCGSGTTGHHGELENEDVFTRKLVGRWIVKHRPDIVEYVLGKLGDGPGRDWFRRRLYADI